MISFLQLLEKKYDGALDEKGKQYLKFAVDGASRMKVLIQDLLAFSMFVDLKGTSELVDLNELVVEILCLLQNKIANKKPTFDISPLPIINSNHSAMRQVFQNLIDNALKYQKDDEIPDIGMKCRDIGDFWEFSVSDNGIGIPEKHLEKIFIIFQRLHHSNEYSGTGMGLAVTKRIIENYGGKIWVTSIQGKGSVFYFTIPK